MAVHRVAVKADFGVQHFQVAAVGDDQRVDFEHFHVFFDECFEQLTHQGDALFDLLAFKPQGESNATAVVGLEARGGVNREADDFFRCGLGYFFDVHAALRGADEPDARGLAIHQQREVQFGFDARTVFDVDAVDLFARGAGLVRDQGAAQHFLGFFGGFFNRFGQAYTAFVASVGFFERTLAAATCVDLCLDDPKRSVHLACGCFRFFSFQHDPAVGYWRAVATQKGFCLIFVDVHKKRSRLCSSLIAVYD